MAEIRQIQVDGVNYDLVISEDEVSATAAAQSAAQALAYKNQAQSSAAQAGQQATNASNQADRAEDAASRAEQIVGGEFLSYGGDQPLTEDEKEQARKNAVVGKSNYNILDNGWFIVNQRGGSSYSGGYTVDRWVTTSSATLTVNSGGTITWATSGTYREFKQHIANPSNYANGTYTVSVKIASTSGVPWLIIHNAGGGEILRNSLTVGMNVFTFTTGESGIGLFGIYNLAVASISVEIEAVKLELGTYSTLVNDTKPDYATELARCISSTADPSDTYANNGFGRSNKNELDNPWFVQFSCINQLEYTSSNSSGEVNCVDRWKVNRANASVTLSGSISSQGLSLAWDGSTSSEGVLTQRLDKNRGSKLVNNPVTVSVLLTNGTIYYGTFIYPSQATGSATVRFTNTLYCTLYNNLDAYATLNIYNQSTTAVKIQAVKLEKGTYSTLANDTPPDYATELMKCLHYKWVVPAKSNYASFGVGVVTTAQTQSMFAIQFPVPMHRNPGFSYSGSFRTVGGNGTSIQIGTVTSMALTSTSLNPTIARIDVTGTNMGTTGNAVLLSADSSTTAKLIFDADIQ